MCRLAAITSSDYFSPLEAILALETMKEGHDGSGLGIMMKDLGGEFGSLKQYPILSGICSDSGLEILDRHMDSHGFKLVHAWTPSLKEVRGIAKRDHYFARAYQYPPSYSDKGAREKDELLLKTRLELRRLGQEQESLIVFSFYPDILCLKEVGDPLEVSEFFGLGDSTLKARIVLAQGRQNTNYAINLYACHPFFIQGFSTMTNGENTAFVPIREYLMSRGFPGYVGYNSDSEVFTHILHYMTKQLGYPLPYYKHVITPLKSSEIDGRGDREVLHLMRKSLRMLCIDGPNCVIGFTPDGTCFMVQDSKKLRPGMVGGVKGKYALMSEECGVDKAIPARDRSKDIFPMKYDMVIISPGAEEVTVWNQLRD